MCPVSWRETVADDSLRLLERIYVKDRGQTSENFRANIAISGGGVSGLATAISLRQYGHKVTVYDEKPTIESIGYGIQIAPNLSRLLLRLGLAPYLKDYVTYPRRLVFRRWQNGRPLGMARLAEFQKLYGSPYMQVNRGHLHEALLKRARDVGVIMCENSKIVDYDLIQPSISLANGQVIMPDLVIAADGLRSMARLKMLASDSDLQESAEFAAYRVAVDVELIKKDSDLQWVLKDPHQNAWIGPDRHVMAYPINGNELLNVVTIAPLAGRSNCSDYRSELLQELSEWDPTIRKLINLAPKVGKWPIWAAPHLPQVISPSHRFIVVGDAAHDMTPYLGQGAAMAVEDAVLLARVLSSLQTIEDVAPALQIYQAMRIPRTSAIRAESNYTRDRFHMKDGQEQRKRDEDAAAELSGKEVKEHLCTFSNPIGQRWLYAYDVENELSSSITRPSGSTKL